MYITNLEPIYLKYRTSIQYTQLFCQAIILGGESDTLKPIEEIAKLCVEEIKKAIKTEVVLYGHCVGSALAIEIARSLEKEKIYIKAIFIGGIIPPRLVKYYGNILDPWKWKNEEEIAKYLNKLGGVTYAFGDNESH
ncbi:thioesterase domain-containing protein [Clostridium sp. CF012]|uniref:thioesterase domain-containing protein n=1 Tax=Clostridium sp. CF012 TaxID=2843319 RepID=UPI001C0D9FF7|nr:thioesterase domain-containing protein [Clostridium sp. CF012]MBU3145499.1 hypothetical protein [Clostridium sp. CF012]